MHTVTKRFEYMGEFIRALRGENMRDDLTGESKDWKGAANIPQAITIMENSEVSQTILDSIRRIVDKIDASVHDRETTAWMPSVAGAYPVVPEYLIGMPENMRARCPVESDVAPIRLIVETGFAAMASQDLIRNYGACITALAMTMSETRPVELWVMDSSVGGSVTTNIAVKLDKPVNIAQCAMAMATPVLGRMIALNYNTCNQQRIKGTVNGAIGFGLGMPSSERADKIRQAFGFESHDVVIQTKLIPDSHLMNSDPVAWVHRQLEKQRTIQD